MQKGPFQPTIWAFCVPRANSLLSAHICYCPCGASLSRGEARQVIAKAGLLTHRPTPYHSENPHTWRMSLRPGQISGQVSGRGHGDAGSTPAMQQLTSPAYVSALSHGAFGLRSTVRGSSDELICLFWGSVNGVQAVRNAFQVTRTPTGVNGKMTHKCTSWVSTETEPHTYKETHTRMHTQTRTYTYVE